MKHRDDPVTAISAISAIAVLAESCTLVVGGISLNFVPHDRQKS